jgi:hypothetical protein
MRRAPPPFGWRIMKKARPRTVPKIHDRGRVATPVGSELDNTEDNFAAGMAGLVKLLGAASFR